MERIYGTTFKAETVEMDGKSFLECEFTECVLRYCGGPLELISSGVFRCHWSFGGAALRTINVLECFELKTSAEAQVPEDAKLILC